MKFWDSSALVPLLVHKAATPFFSAVYARDPLMTVWWGTKVECVSALARYERDPRAAIGLNIADGFRRLEDAASHWHEIAASESVRETALILLRRHVLRAADALQLGAATVARQERGAALEFVCADRNLSQAAVNDGFNVLSPETA